MSYKSSCFVTLVAENQHIFTSNENLQSLRKNIVELVLTDHPMECNTYEETIPELQTVANDLGISDHIASPKQHKGIPRDTSHDYMRMNLDNCMTRRQELVMKSKDHLCLQCLEEDLSQNNN